MDTRGKITIFASLLMILRSRVISRDLAWSRVISRDLAWSCKMSNKIYPGSLSEHQMLIEWSLMVCLVKSTFVFIGPAIVAFVRRKLGNFCKSRKLQTVQAHRIECHKPSWRTGYNPSVSMCGLTFKAQHWHLLEWCSMMASRRLSRCCQLLSNACFSFELRSTITYAIVRSSCRYPT